MNYNEKRSNERIPFTTVVDIQIKDKKYNQCSSRDLSMQGIKILGISEAKIGDYCKITLHLTGSTSDLKLNFDAQVVRSNEDEIAVKFLSIELDSYHHLKNIITYNSQFMD